VVARKPMATACRTVGSSAVVAYCALMGLWAVRWGSILAGGTKHARHSVADGLTASVCTATTPRCLGIGVFPHRRLVLVAWMRDLRLPCEGVDGPRMLGDWVSAPGG